MKRPVDQWNCWSSSALLEAEDWHPWMIGSQPWSSNYAFGYFEKLSLWKQCSFYQNWKKWPTLSSPWARHGVYLIILFLQSWLYKQNRRVFFCTCCTQSWVSGKRPVPLSCPCRPPSSAAPQLSWLGRCLLCCCWRCCPSWCSWDAKRKQREVHRVNEHHFKPREQQHRPDIAACPLGAVILHHQFLFYLKDQFSSTPPMIYFIWRRIWRALKAAAGQRFDIFASLSVVERFIVFFCLSFVCSTDGPFWTVFPEIIWGLWTLLGPSALQFPSIHLGTCIPEQICPLPTTICSTFSWKCAAAEAAGLPSLQISPVTTPCSHFQPLWPPPSWTASGDRGGTWPQMCFITMCMEAFFYSSYFHSFFSVPSPQNERNQTLWNRCLVKGDADAGFIVLCTLHGPQTGS